MCTRLVLVGLLLVLALIVLAVFVPPDGRERGELGRFFGNLHPLAVHLPIALLLLVPVLEIAAVNSRRRELRQAAGFVLGLAVASAIVAPYLGWLLARSNGFEGEFVTQHMWGGIAVATAALLCGVLRGRARDESESNLPRSYVGGLTLAVVLLVFTGYRGAQIAHGEDHLTEHLPRSLQAWLGMAGTNAPNGGADTFYAARIAPIFDDHCVLCHGRSKRKADLRLDSHAGLLAGGKHGAVIKAGDAKSSELFRRVSLDPTHEDFMPAEGKPPLRDDDRALLRLWINAGASATLAANAIVGAPVVKPRAEPLAPDYHADRQAIARLESALNIRLIPRSRNPSDGLVLRTASFPAACDDSALKSLAPVARYIVDAELARTKVTDAGLKLLAQFANLRVLDLSHTAVTSAGVHELARLPKLELLNLTDTAIDDRGVAPLRHSASLKRLYLFQTRAALESVSSPPFVAGGSNE